MPTLKRPAAASKTVAQASTEKTAAAKKPKLDPVARQCTEVARALNEADIPQSVAAMLADMLPMALPVPSDQRDRFQHSVVSMVCDVLSSLEAGHVKALEAARAASSASEEMRAARQAEVATAEADCQAKQSVLQAKKASLAEDARRFRLAKEKVSQERAGYAAVLAELDAVATKKDQLQNAELQYVKVLSEGLEDPSLAGALAESLADKLRTFEFDPSMVVAVPNAFGKPPASRGTFDSMVMSQVTQELSKRIAALDEVLIEGEPRKSSVSAAAKAAEEALTQATASQLASAQAFKGAQKDLDEATVALTGASKAVRALATERNSLNKKEAASEARLSKFRDGPLATCLELRDRQTPVEEPEGEELKKPEAGDVVDEGEGGQDVKALA